MGETLGTLDTASTKDIIAALAARLTAQLGQACGGQEDTRAIAMTISALRADLLRQVTAALDKECGAYFEAHPAYSPDAMVEMLIDLVTGAGKKGRAGDSFRPRRADPFGI